LKWGTCRDDWQPHGAGAADVDVECALEPLGDGSPARRWPRLSERSTAV
jgi:hypothetical protein